MARRRAPPQSPQRSRSSLSPRLPPASLTTAPHAGSPRAGAREVANGDPSEQEPTRHAGLATLRQPRVALPSHQHRPTTPPVSPRASTPRAPTRKLANGDPSKQEYTHHAGLATLRHPASPSRRISIVPRHPPYRPIQPITEQKLRHGGHAVLFLSLLASFQQLSAVAAPIKSRRRSSARHPAQRARHADCVTPVAHVRVS